MLMGNLSEYAHGGAASRKDPMAQAPAVDTDELLSQLAASEIDRLLAEADGKGNAAEAPVAAAETAALNSIAASTAEALTEGSEREALLKAAGFDSPKAAGPDAPEAGSGQPTGAERSALLRAAGFESADSTAAKPVKAPADEDMDRPIPVYLKPLIWINAPLEACPPSVRPILGKAGLLTLVNAVAVLAYLFFTRKH
jgi:hypothetical protein